MLSPLRVGACTARYGELGNVAGCHHYRPQLPTYRLLVQRQQSVVDVFALVDEPTLHGLHGVECFVVRF